MPFEGLDAPPIPVSRPANYTRSLVHVASGAFALALLRLLPGRSWLIAASGAFFVAAWSMETLRRKSPAANERMMKFFRAIAHPHERYKVNSSTWYITALFLLALFAPLRAAELGVIVLAAADPAAGFIGRRYGSVRLRQGRSLEGSLSFLVVGALVALGWLWAAYGLSFPQVLIVAGAGALVGALTELISTRLDDNFTIPVAVAAASAGAEMLVTALSRTA